MSQFLSIDCATVVNREIRGENSLYIIAYSPTHSLMQTMKKIPSKKTSVMPDLFDDISFDCEMSSPTSLKFIREFSIKKRRTAVAASYDSFEQAALIAQTVLANGRHIEDSATLSHRLRMSLDSIAEGAPAEIVRLKFMYLLARDEGYAVREDFYARLPAQKKELFSVLIKTPSAELKEFKTRSANILESLCRWIYANTDIQE